jgi:hypothetical protein
LKRLPAAHDGDASVNNEDKKTTLVVQAMRTMMTNVLKENMLPKEMLAYTTIFVVTNSVWEVTTTSKVITRTAMMILLPR